MDRRWSEKRIWKWYNERPWIRGCNFMGSDVVNWLDMWQEYGFEEKLETAEREIELLVETGYNAIRSLLFYPIWKEQYEGCMERLERFLDMLDRHGVKLVPVLGNDCQVTKDNPYCFLKSGPQHYDWGYHGGRKWSQHSTKSTEPGYWLIDDEPEEVYSWVRDILERHKDDDRILFWDLYNEPGNARREKLTIPHIKKFFEIAREVNPTQPLTAGAWRVSGKGAPFCEVEQYAIDHSDIITYHSYSAYLRNVQVIRRLKQYGRPIINTEWLGRTRHNTVQEMFPLFYALRIGCFNWGFVAGRYQTYEPWESTWEKYYRGEQTDIDFTKWYHDLYRPNHRPYDPKEIEIIKTLTEAADKEFEASRS